MRFQTPYLVAESPLIKDVNVLTWERLNPDPNPNPNPKVNPSPNPGARLRLGTSLLAS